MGFIFYDLLFLGLFVSVVGVFLYKNWKNVKREGILLLYKSKFGIDAIKAIGERHKKFLDKCEGFVVFVGYLLMAAMIYFLVKFASFFVKQPDFAKVIKIPPIVPLIPYLPELFNADYLPPFYFTYWILALAITAIVHEFFHGIFARSNDVKIKSTGFAFLGPFIGAFVEPDENKVSKLKTKHQLAILSAGSFSNLIVAVVFFFVLWGFFASAFQTSGATFNFYDFKIINSTDISEIKGSIYINFDGGLNLTEIKAGNETLFVKNASQKGYIIAFKDSPALRSGLQGAILEVDGVKIESYKMLNKTLSDKNPNQSIIIKTLLNNSEKEYNITLGEKNGKAWLGIAVIAYETEGVFSKLRSAIMFFKDPNIYYKPRFLDELVVFVYNLIWWIAFINLSVALVNMMPLGIFDGGRVFYLTMKKLTGSENAAKKLFVAVTYLLLGFFIVLTVFWFLRK